MPLKRLPRDPCSEDPWSLSYLGPKSSAFLQFYGLPIFLKFLKKIKKFFLQLARVNFCFLESKRPTDTGGEGFGQVSSKVSSSLHTPNEDQSMTDGWNEITSP